MPAAALVTCSGVGLAAAADATTSLASTCTPAPAPALAAAVAAPRAAPGGCASSPASTGAGTTAGGSAPVGRPGHPALSSTGVGAAPQQVAAPVPAGGSLALLDAGGSVARALSVPGQGTYTAVADHLGFTPMPSFLGSAQPARFRVSGPDGHGVRGTYTPTVSRPASPVAVDLSSSGPAGQAQSAQLAAHPGSTVALLGAGAVMSPSVSVAGQGTYTLSAGTVRFTPVAGFAGRAVAGRYRLTDSYGQSGDATYRPTVHQPVGQPAPDPVDTDPAAAAERARAAEAARAAAAAAAAASAAADLAGRTTVIAEPAAQTTAAQTTAAQSSAAQSSAAQTSAAQTSAAQTSAARDPFSAGTQTAAGGAPAGQPVLVVPVTNRAVSDPFGSAGTPTTGTPTTGTPTTGTPSAGTPTAGTPTAGTSPGTPTAGTPTTTAAPGRTSLPYTGSDLETMVGLALTLLAAGIAATTLSRRSRS